MKQTPQKLDSLDNPDYFEEWWSRQPLVYRQSQEHYNLAKYRWVKIKQFLILIIAYVPKWLFV